MGSHGPSIVFESGLTCDTLTSWFHPDTDPYFQFSEAPRSLLAKDNETWIACHKEWLNEAPEAHFRVMEDSTHSLHLDQESVVFEEIIQALKAAR